MEGDDNDIYRECLRNHAASLGSYATDGCGEFTLHHTHPASLNCAACGCHRNFHRKLITTTAPAHLSQEPSAVAMSSGICGGGGMKKRFRTKFTAEQKEKMLRFAEKLGWRVQRKEAGVDEDEIETFCRGIGITRRVFKVWMHNHKSFVSSSSPSTSPSPSTLTGNASSLTQ